MQTKLIITSLCLITFIQGCHKQTTDSFDKLKPFKQRQYVSKNADLTDTKTIEKLYTKLIEQPVNSSCDFENWLMMRTEIESAVWQTSSILRVRMNCHTDDEQIGKAYKDYISNVSPVISKYSNKLDKLFIEYMDKYPITNGKLDIYTRNAKSDIEIYREENIDLFKQIRLLDGNFDSLSGSMTVDFDGKEQTMQQMSKYLYEQDRKLREKAWKTRTERKLKEKDKFNDIFDEMVKLRHQAALNAGFENYRDFAFKAKNRFDYTPEDCFAYHEAVEKIVVPLSRKLSQKRMKQMGLEIMKPWDLYCDPLGRKPLKPFETTDELIDGASNIFAKVDPDISECFEFMKDNGLLDLDSRIGKAPGGYQMTLYESRKPFIFMNAVGSSRNVDTLFHEGGHALHTWLRAKDPYFNYIYSPMEFNEVASMSMELIAMDHISEFYNEEDARRAMEKQIRGSIYTLISVAKIDAFQHWLYENPDHTRKQREEKWYELYQRYSTGLVDYEGYDDAIANSWQTIPHLYGSAFYYIEYGIAQLGALQVWANHKKAPAEALEAYKNALALGGSKPLPKLFETANIKFDFSAETIEPLMQDVWTELEKLN